jgi:HEAT repeat protein
MSGGTFQSDFSIASTERGARYKESRDRIRALEPTARSQASAHLQQVLAGPSDWQTRLTAEILLGWLSNEPAFLTSDAYVRGELPRPAPLPGFTANHRAAFIAELGPAVVPHILERLWKTREYADDTESSALFASLEILKDPRAVMPMIALIEDKTSSPDERSSAAGVLSVLGDLRGLEPVLRLAQDQTAAPVARVSAIRCLGRFDDPRASGGLARILSSENLPIEDRRAAADGLRNRSDAATRPSIISVLQKTDDRLLRLTLIRTLGQIGTAEDIPQLRKLAAENPALKAEIDDAIEDIQRRQPTLRKP